MDRTYAGSFGRIKAYESDFLSMSYLNDLMDKSVDDITQHLMGTFYREDIEAYFSIYKNPDLLEIAFNRRLMRRNSIALSAPPPGASTFLKTYFMKWDIENIKAVIASKILGYSIRQSEAFLISFRDIPMGMYGGVLSEEDYKIMIGLGSVENIVEFLTRYPIGTFLLQYLDEYRKTRDTSHLFGAMDRYFYDTSLASLRFYNGDEAPVRRYFREEIDSRNIMLILKAIDLKVQWDDIRESLIIGGSIAQPELEELYRSGGVPDAAARLKERYDFEEAVSTYQNEGLLYKFEITMKKTRHQTIGHMRSLGASLAGLFSFILRSEIERENLRAIVAGKSTGLSDDRIKELVYMEAV